jgi:hypothetical protein
MGIPPRSNFSFRPRRPIANPIEIQRQEYERQIQLKNEAKERSKQYSKQNKQGNTMNSFIVCPGNNSGIIKKCMELRAERWEET